MARHGTPGTLTADDLRTLLQATFDAASWRAASSQHLHVRIGNEPPAVGSPAALAALSSFLARVDEVGCRYFDSWRMGNTIAVETDVCFRGEAGRRLELPCAIVARVQGTELVDLRVYLDPSPLPARDTDAGAGPAPGTNRS